MSKAENTINLSSRTATLLVASAMFAHEVITAAASAANSDPVLETAERYGLCERRAPFADELADPDWFGNHAPVAFEDVPDLAPDFAELVAGLEDSIGSTRT